MRFRRPAALLLLLAFACAPGLAADDRPRFGDGLDLSTLAGEHTVRGRNPNGTAYEGKVRIRIKEPLVLMEWNTDGQLSYGTGLVEGMTLGVALESGVAIYQIVPQAEGKSLIGLWAQEAAKTANEEIIFIGEADLKHAQFEVLAINGPYRARSGGVKGSSTVTISGDDIVKRLEVESGDRRASAEGLALGDGLAVITPDGLSVFRIRHTGKKLSIEGHSSDSSGQVREVVLEPVP